MNWDNMISVIIGGIIATVSTLVASSFSAKKERVKLILDQKINTFQEFIPIIKSEFEIDELKKGSIRPYDIPKIKLLSSKVILLCNTKTRGLINELINVLIKYNNFSIRKTSEVDIVEGLNLITKVIPDYCERIQNSLSEELDQINSKSYNYQKGFFRLIVVLSILIGIFIIINATSISINQSEPWILGLFGFLGVWSLYVFLRYVIVEYVLHGFTK